MSQFMSHTSGKNGRKHVIDVIFPIAVFFVFAASALAVLMLSSKVYDTTSTTASDNYSSRTAFAYVSEKLRQHDSAGEISAKVIDGSDYLVLKEDGISTYIYLYDGKLKELRVRDGADVTFASGTDIASAKAFSVACEGTLYFIDITTEDGTEYSLVSSERSTR